MCDQCVCGSQRICEPITGWKLIRATDDGLWSICKGDLGLVSLEVDQDVDVVIPQVVIPHLPAMTWGDFLYREDIPFDRENNSFSDNEVDRIADENMDLIERVSKFAVAMKERSKMDALADLVAASVSSGWVGNKDGDWSWWLYERLARVLDNDNE